MDDLVSRKWLLEEYDRRHRGPRGGAYQMILDAPSAERPTGRWYLDNGCAFCSECKNSFTPKIRKQALFCPRCGAKMLSSTNAEAEWQYKTMSVPGGKGQTYAKWSCSACKGKQTHRSQYCPNCGKRMRNGGQDDV